MRRFLVLATALSAGALAGCGGGDEVAGDNGINSLISSTPEAAGDNCENGGVRLDFGPDTNADGALDAEEIVDTQYSCNESSGEDGGGFTTLVSTTVEPAGANCAEGGQRVDFGVDDNADGTLDSAEVDGTSFVCNGLTGDDGQTSLIASSTEAPGANCAAGGVRVDAGFDASADGVLDAGEIATTTFACNGLNSLVVSSVIAAGGACGAVAGNQIDMGIDLDNDGSLQAGEIITSAQMCDGADGFDALVNQTVIAAGGACGVATGVQVDSGLDTDRSGVLDAGEIVNTSDLCNAADGANGAPGANGPASLVVLTDAGANCANGGVQVDTGVDTDNSGVLDADEITDTAFACNGVVIGDTPFATAQIRANSKRIVFLFAPAGTSMDTHAEYASYCQDNGFEQNQNSNTNAVYANAGNFNNVDFYCEQFCCYLGDGNSQAAQVVDFQNFGLPLTSELRVFDRGCGNRLNDFSTGLVTNDRIDVTSDTAFAYTASNYGAADHSVPSVTTIDRDGVVICQEP